jgi:hypothetical protein
METGFMEEGRQRNKNRNAKPTPTDNTQNSAGQINEDNVQKNWQMGHQANQKYLDDG